MENLPISITDIAVAVILLLSGLLALSRGFVHEVLSIGSWVGAAFAALFGFAHVRPYARDLIENEMIADITAGAGTFIIALVILTIVTKLIAEQVQDSSLNPLDRSLGFVFGLFRGVLIVCLIYGAVSWFIPVKDQPDWMRSAKTMPMIEQGTDILKGLIPSDAAEKLANEAEEQRTKANNAIELKKTFDKMVSPDAKPTKEELLKQLEGYSEQERKDLERLIRNAQ